MEESAQTDVFSEQLLPRYGVKYGVSMESKFLDLKQCMKLTKVMISHAKTPSVYNNVAK